MFLFFKNEIQHGPFTPLFITVTNRAPIWLIGPDLALCPSSNLDLEVRLYSSCIVGVHPNSSSLCSSISILFGTHEEPLGIHWRYGGPFLDVHYFSVECCCTCDVLGIIGQFKLDIVWFSTTLPNQTGFCKIYPTYLSQNMDRRKGQPWCSCFASHGVRELVCHNQDPLNSHVCSRI